MPRSSSLCSILGMFYLHCMGNPALARLSVTALRQHEIVRRGGERTIRPETLQSQAEPSLLPRTLHLPSCDPECQTPPLDLSLRSQWLRCLRSGSDTPPIVAHHSWGAHRPPG